MLVGLLLCAGLLLAPGGAARAQAAAGNPGWVSAPIFGGDVRSLAFDPDDPDQVYAGTSGGHVYRSTDAGESWVDAGQPVPFDGWVVASLQFDPNRPQGDGGQPARLWAALWGVWGGGAVAFSDDAGVTWRSRHAGLPGQVYSLALVPGRAGWIYVGTRTGVYRSTDGGERWQHITQPWPEIQKVTSLWVDPERPGRLLAGTWQRAYVSEDGGDGWSGVFEGMIPDSEVFSLSAVPGHDDEMWASTCGWVYRSLDRGESWTRFRDGLTTRRVPAFLPLPDGQLLAGTVRGLFGSTTGGQSWQRRTSEELSVLALAYHPRRPRRVLMGTEGSGVWVSDDGGASFRPAPKAMINVRVVALARTGGALLAAVNHAGPASGIYRSLPDGGFTQEAQVPAVLALAADGGLAWAATEQGLWERIGRPDGTMGWQRRPELGERRIEDLAVAGHRVVARTLDGLFERSQDGVFDALNAAGGPPRSMAMLGEEIWVSARDGLYRWTATERQPVSTPFTGGRLLALGDLLLLSGEGGLWSRRGLPGAWHQLGAEPARALATGSADQPLLVLRGDDALLLRLGPSAPGPELGSEPVAASYQPLDLGVPARDVAAVQVYDGRLWIATIGQGLRSRALPMVLADASQVPAASAPEVTAPEAAAGSSP